MFPQYPNPINDFYLQQAQLAMNRQPAQFPGPMQMQQQNPANQIVSRFVTNEQEAKAAMVDALSTYIFIDAGSGKIYLKKMNNNGLSDFYTYVVDESNVPKTKADPMQEINSRLSNIENIIGDLKIDKSIPGNADVPESEGAIKPAATGKNAANGASESGSL